MASLPMTLTTWVRPAWSHYTFQADSVMPYRNLSDYLVAFRGTTQERNSLLEAAAGEDEAALFVLAIRMDQTFRMHYEGAISDHNFSMFFWKLGSYFNSFHKQVYNWAHVLCHLENYEWFPRQHLNILNTYPNLQRLVPIREDTLTEATPVMQAQPLDEEMLRIVDHGDTQPTLVDHGDTQSTSNGRVSGFSFHTKETHGDSTNEFTIHAADVADATAFDSNHIQCRGKEDRKSIQCRGEEDRKSIQFRGEEDRKSIQLRGEEERKSLLVQRENDTARLDKERENNMARLDKERENEETRLNKQLELAKLNLMTARVQSAQKPPPAEGQAYMNRQDDPLSSLVSPNAQTPCRNKRLYAEETFTPNKESRPRPGVNNFQPSNIEFDHFPESNEIQNALGVVCPQNCGFRCGRGTRPRHGSLWESRVLECGCRALAEKCTGKKIHFCCKVRVVEMEGVYYVEASGKEDLKYHVDAEGRQIKDLKEPPGTRTSESSMRV